MMVVAEAVVLVLIPHTFIIYIQGDPYTYIFVLIRWFLKVGPNIDCE